MTKEDWDFDFGHSLMVHLNGDGILESDTRGERIVDDSFTMIFNAYSEPITFKLPVYADVQATPANEAQDRRWHVVIDTTIPTGVPQEPVVHKAGGNVEVPARSVLVLRRRRAEKTPNGNR